VAPVTGGRMGRPLIRQSRPLRSSPQESSSDRRWRPAPLPSCSVRERPSTTDRASVNRLAALVVDYHLAATHNGSSATSGAVQTFRRTSMAVPENPAPWCALKPANQKSVDGQALTAG